MAFNLGQSPLDKRKALVEITLTTSSQTLSLSAGDKADPPFRLILNARIVESSQPGRPITICTYCSPLDTRSGIDIMAMNRFSLLQSTTNPSKTICLGIIRPNFRPHEEPRDLRQRYWLTWLTIPADKSVQVTHDLPLSRMLQHETNVKREDLEPGETFRVNMRDSYLHVEWWCWGDLEDDLKYKKFSQWRHGWMILNQGVEKPDQDEIENGWVLGEDPTELWIQDGDSRGAQFTFVE